MKIDANKLIGMLLVAILGMASWYLKTVSTDLNYLRSDVNQMREDMFVSRMENYRLAVSIEISQGGDPSKIPAPTMATQSSKR